MIRYRATRPRLDRGTAPRKGIVLFVVMVLVAMVAFAGFGFVSMMSTEYQATRRHGEELQAAQAIASAEALVLNFAQLSDTERALVGSHIDNPGMFQGIPLQPAIRPRTTTAAPAVETASGWHVSIVSPTRETLDEQTLRFGLENESARLHLSTLLAWDREYPGSGRQALTRLPNMTDAIADAILDWCDSDDIPREFGAESEAYLANGSGYLPRQGVPQLLDELLLVQGVTRELLFGLDEDQNFRVDLEESQRGNTTKLDSQPAPDLESSPGGWSDHLTLYSAERNRDPWGQPRVDLNQNDLQRLAASLSNVLPKDLVEFIVAWRQFGPASGNASAASGSVQRSAGAPSISTTQPARYRLHSLCDLIDARVRIDVQDDAPSAQRLLQSPLSSTASNKQQLLEALLNHTTLNPEAIIIGRININLAPESVLQGLPGLSEDVVQQILVRRETEDSAPRSTTAWLWAEGLVERPQYRKLEPWITGGGDSFRGQLAAFQTDSGPIYRSQIVVGPMRGGVHRLHWRELRSLGSGFSAQQLQRQSFMD